MRILLAVDESKDSTHAAEALTHFAPPEQLIMLNVMDIPHVGTQSLWLKMKDLPDIVEQETHCHAEKILKRLEASLPATKGSIAQHIEKGSPAEVILDMAEQKQIDLIVMGARGLNRLSEIVLGSVSHRVLSHAPCSTLIVKSPLLKLEHILLPIQGGEDTKKAVSFFKKIPFTKRPFISIMHTIPLDEQYWMEGALPSPSIREELVASGKYLTEIAVSQLKDLGYQAESLVRYGRPADLIQATVAENHPDLVIVGSQGRSGVSRFLIGSVSHSVVHRMSSSVLVIR